MNLTTKMTNSILDKIVKQKKREIAYLKKINFETNIKPVSNAISFKKNLSKPGLNLIAEISSKKSELNTEEYQSLVYKYGKQVYPDNLRDWFIVSMKFFLDQKVGPDLVLYLICIKRRKS